MALVHDTLSHRALPTALSAEQNHLCNFGRGHHGEHFCEIILNLDQWLRHFSSRAQATPVLSQAKLFVQFW